MIVAKLPQMLINSCLASCKCVRSDHWRLGKDGNDAGTVFPAVPNRWLVTRSHGSFDQPVKQWVVESDYLYPEGKGGDTGSISFPYHRTRMIQDLAKRRYQPYRYMGRRLPLAAWLHKETNAVKDEYLNRIDGHLLTALGYG